MAATAARAMKQSMKTPTEFQQAATRDGFGQALVELGKTNTQVVALSADLAESTRMVEFAKAYPDRFIQVGVAEQNLVTVSAGLAAEGKIPFCSSFATFSPGRNWEQIRTTICYNNQPVIIVGSHTGLGVGEDGATHQALEDIALMRVLPNMTVVVPCDAEQARKATHALADYGHPAYLRLNRQKTAVFTTPGTPFTLGKADVYWQGSDVTVIATGPLVYEALLAAAQLESSISVEVINVHTIKPLDAQTILRSVRKTGCVVTVEEHQKHSGLGSAVAELLAQTTPKPVEMVAINDTFGESGDVKELWKHHGLTVEHIIKQIHKAIKRKA